MTEKAASEIMDGIANLFQGLADVSVNAIALLTVPEDKFIRKW
jgi:hypothetical protein